LSDAGAVPMIVMTRSQDHVEAVNSTLRNAGHPAHCTWISDLRDLSDALTQINPELLVCFTEEQGIDLGTIMKIRNQFGPEVPVLIVRARVDEEVIAEAMRIGAQDVISLGNRNRLQSVVTRELRAFRLERALNATLNSAREYKQQLQTFMAGSADAIAHVADGIVVDANPAWLELFGFSDADSLVGQPLMDLFDEDRQAALKGALVATMQGKWSDHTLRMNAQLSDGSALALELTLERSEFDGEQCVRVCVPAHKDNEQAIAERLQEAVRTDPSTGFLHRKYFIDAARARLQQPVKGGVRYVAYIKPDKFTAVQSDIGIMASEDFLVAFGEILHDQLQPNDIAGRFGGNSFAVLLERGNARDVEAWAEHVVKKVGAHTFQVADKSLSATCTVGLGMLPATNPDLGSALSDAAAANRRGRDQGGGQFYVVDKSDTDTRVQAYDKIWVKHIKSALMENRFRLVQQPIASLQGDDKGMFDVLVRMLDEQQKEVLPSEFMQAAERNDLLKNIDRWVIGASMSFCAARKPSCIFVRLSKDTVIDKSLATWLGNQLKASKVDPSRICFQVTEETAAQYITQTREMIKALKPMGFRLALEHLGAGRDPVSLVQNLAVDFVKIDGSLMQGLASNPILQQKVKGLVDAAKKKRIETIAERVEDANTMAVLWQLGIEFIQGYFVNAPEEVVLKADR
jgi:diguanylate cyclase (GGDEF)-like protein/PAS domain S-box-containing protein